METDEMKVLREQLLPLVTDSGYQYLIEKYRARLKDVEKQILEYTDKDMHQFDRLQGERKTLVWVLSLLKSEIGSIDESLVRDKERKEEDDDY